MKNEKTVAWADALDTTQIAQTRNYLAKVRNGEVIGACCLGIGCITAEIEPIEVLHMDREGNWIGLYAFGEVENKQLPPTSFAAWLGLDVYDSEGNQFDETHEWSLVPDWGDLSGRCSEPSHTDPSDCTDHFGSVAARRYDMSFDFLNDGLGLTFSQIADVVRYFGVRQP